MQYRPAHTIILLSPVVLKCVACHVPTKEIAFTKLLPLSNSLLAYFELSSRS